jgi:phage FluMu gp28-like protein
MRMVPKQPIKDRYVYVGVDLARHEAFTVFIALDDEGNLVGFERFRRLDFPFQKQRLLAFLEYFPMRQVIMDARGLGTSVFEDLKRENILIEGVKLTNPLKNELVHNLVIKLDDLKIRGPYIDQLVEELEAFTYHVTSSGNIVYEAPENFYDDCVSALMFATSKLRERATDWISLRGPSYLELRSREEELYAVTRT